MVSSTSGDSHGERQVTLTEHRKVAKDRQLQSNEIVGVDPVLRCLPNESALVASSGGIPFNWMTASSDEIIEFREFNDDSIIVILIKRSFLEVSLDKSGFQGSVGSFLRWVR